MPSETSEERASTPQSTARSKQERIRDNQRRSRARRQEYLADLEKRLSECQITCRDADIQRAAFIELQIENARLRELLSLAGVNEQFVENYVSQAVAQGSQFPQEVNPALRQLKPKIDPGRMLSNSVASNSTGNINTVLQPNATPGPGNIRRHSHNVISTTVPTMNLTDQNLVSSPTSPFSSMSPFAPSLTDMSSSSNFDWLYRQNQVLPTQTIPEPTLCDAFGVPAQAPGRPPDDGTILCSVAKQMIEQYNVPPQEMEQIKTRIARGCWQPIVPGGGCSVDNQVLFQILNELSTKYA